MSWFDPEGAAWTYVSRRLIPARLLVLWLFFGPLTVAAALFGPRDGWWAALPAALGALGLWFTWVAARQVTAHAWAERDDDLVVKRGRIFRRVTVVPYGRMQFVDVTAGPVARVLGIARVQLHTASPGTDAHISGVPAAEAARLRDRLTTRGEARLAGL